MGGTGRTIRAVNAMSADDEEELSPALVAARDRRHTSGGRPRDGAPKRRPKKPPTKRKVAPKGRHNVSGAKAIANLETQITIMDLRKKGFTYDQIAHRVGKDRAVVVRSVFRTLEEMVKMHRERANSLRELEGGRMEEVIKIAMKVLQDSGDMRAAEVVIKASARRAALYGLDTPTRTEVTGKNGSPIQITNWSQIMIAAMEAEKTATAHDKYEADPDVTTLDAESRPLEPGDVGDDAHRPSETPMLDVGGDEH